MDKPNSSSDPKLELKTSVPLQRLDLLQHLESLSEDCLRDLQSELRENVLKAPRVLRPRNLAATSETKKVTCDDDDDDDDIQIIEVKASPKKKQSKVELQRGKQDIRARKAGKKASLSRDSFKKIASKTALAEMTDPSKAAGGLPQLGGVINEVNEKLASLKDRERRLTELARRRKMRELLLEKSDPSTSAFNFLKPAAPKSEKIERKEQKKEQAFDFSLSDPATWKILQMPAKTIEDKYHILDARDKLLQSKRDKFSDQGHRLVGTCPDMCPEKERLRRCYQSQLSPFEMIDHPRNTEMREEWMVKEYARSSADQDTPLPHDLRPVAVLERTMEHLCRNIADRTETTNDYLAEWYLFMWDRTRAIRKDLTHQDACSGAAVRLLEQIARFHAHCAERLAGQDPQVYDDTINTVNLTKCLQTLKYLYNDLPSQGVICPNAPQFLAQSLLLNLNNPAIMTEVRDMPEDVLASAPMVFALDIISARERKDYIRFFRLVMRTSYLNCCILRRYFSEMRLHAFSSMVRAFCPQRTVTVPLLPMVESLLYESVDQCVEHLALCGLSVVSRDGVPLAVLDRTAFHMPHTAFPAEPSRMYVQEKKRVPASEVIWGVPLDDAPGARPSVQNSFTNSGQFKMEGLPLNLLVPPSTSGRQNAPSVPEKREIIAYDDVEPIFEMNYEYDDEPAAVQPVFSAKPVVAPEAALEPSSGATFSGFRNTQESNKLVGFSFRDIFGAPPRDHTQPRLVDSNKPGPTTPSNPALLPLFAMAPEQFLTKYGIVPIESNNIELVHTKTDPLDKQRAAAVAEQRERAESLRIEQEAERLSKQIEREKEEQRMLLNAQIREFEQEKERALKKEQDRQSQLHWERIQAEQKAQDKRNKQKQKAQQILAERKTMSTKLEALGEKYRHWKLIEMGRTWRRKAWAAAEARKMEKYLATLAISYPPICGPELLQGNALGVVIPNSLLVRRRPTKELRINMADLTSRGMSAGPPPVLPLVHIGRAVAPALQARVQALYPEPSSRFRTCFPYKLLLCLPDETETKIRLDTFLEMHFVERFDWKFGEEPGPLAYCEYQVGALELAMSVRRVRGLSLLEGRVANPVAAQGVNSLLFFLTDDAAMLPTARARLDKLRSLPGGAEVPVVAFVFGDRLRESLVRSALRLESSAHLVSCGGASQHSLVSTLSESLSLAASVAAPVPSVRSATLSSLLRTHLMDHAWRRAQIALVNYHIHLCSPDPLIKFYNQSLDCLAARFLDPALDSQARVASEFEPVLSRLESPLQLRPAPSHDAAYCQRLATFVDKLKLPAWPSGPLRTTQQLTYRLHQYGKFVTNGDRKAQKQLKWRVYRLIQKVLLWKGLDIYCDEDIQVVLMRFPWVPVFQEFARGRVETALAAGLDLVVTYSQSDIADFSFDTPLLDNLAAYSVETEPSDRDETLPVPEKDSVLLSYAKMIERDTLAAEADLSPEPSMTEQVSRVWELSYQAETVPKSPKPLQDPADGGLKRSFADLDCAIADLYARLEKRRKLIDDVMTEMALSPCVGDDQAL